MADAPSESPIFLNVSDEIPSIMLVFFIFMDKTAVSLFLVLSAVIVTTCSNSFTISFNLTSSITVASPLFTTMSLITGDSKEGKSNLIE